MKSNSLINVLSNLDRLLLKHPDLRKYLQIAGINPDNFTTFNQDYLSEQKKLIGIFINYPIFYKKIINYIITNKSAIDYLDRFSPEQLDYITNLSTSDTKLLACAGSGKTRSIIGRIKFIVDFKLAKKEDIYCITFSKHAASDFHSKVRKLFPDYDNFCLLKNFSTIDSLAKSILCRVKTHKSSNVEILSIAFRNFLLHITDDEINIVNRIKKIEHLFIDEAQDLNEVQYECAILLQKHFGTKIHLIGDPNQNIYQFRRADSSFLMKHQGTVFELTLNFRSTNQIIGFAEGLKPVPTTPSKSATNKSGPPIGIIVNNRRTIQDMILQYIKWYSNIGDISDIAIICPTRGIKSRATVGLSVFFNFLSMNKIPINRLYDEAGIMADRAKDTEKKSGHVSLITYHGTKGLEYDTVFVMDFYQNLFNINPTQSDHSIFRYLLYVACSRAINRMFVCVYSEENGGSVNHWMTNIDSSTYFIDKPLPIPKLNFREDDGGIPLMGITEIIGNLTDIQLNEIDDILKVDESTNLYTFRLYKDHTKIDRNKDEALFGIFCEELFYLMHSLINKQTPRRISMIDNFISSLFVVIENELDYQYIKKNITEAHLSWAEYDRMQTIIPRFIQELINRKFPRTRELYEYMPCKNDFLEIINNNMIDIKETYARYLNPAGYSFDYKLILDDFFYLIIVIYAYGINHFYYINNHGHEKIDTMKNGLELYADMYIMIESRFARRTIRPKVKVEYKKLHIFGEIDFIDNTDDLEMICEIKCVSSMSMKYYLQVFLYNFCYYLKQKSIKKLYRNRFRIINLLTGLEHNLIFEISPTNMFKLMKHICIAGNLFFDSMKLVYDLETTDRINSQRTFSIENKLRTEYKQCGINPPAYMAFTYPEIIEIAIRDYDTDMIIYNRLVKPTHPISNLISNLTGITNEMLSNQMSQDEFKKEFIDLMKLFSHSFFMAHNGISFDNKIMLYEKLLDPQEVEFIDTMHLIPIHMPMYDELAEKNVSYIYSKIVGGKFNAHRAMSDVNALIKIMRKLKIVV